MYTTSQRGHAPVVRPVVGQGCSRRNAVRRLDVGPFGALLLELVLWLWFLLVPALVVVLRLVVELLLLLVGLVLLLPALVAVLRLVVELLLLLVGLELLVPALVLRFAFELEELVVGVGLAGSYVVRAGRVDFGRGFGVVEYVEGDGAR
jgi:hypothetical protein